MFRRTLLVTHSSRFHADDVCATAVLLLLLKKRGVPSWRVKIKRTRDSSWHKRADFLYDVGGEYNPETRRFDHHQKGGAGERENGIPYAAFGLIWKEYGEEICGDKEVAGIFDRKVVQPIDALDNGKQIFTQVTTGVNPYLIQDVIGSFNPSWKEDFQNIDSTFFEAVSYIYPILQREMKKIKDYKEGETYIKDIYNKSSDKRLIIMDTYYPYELFLSSVPEPLLVVRPSPQDVKWKVETIQSDYLSSSFEQRLKLPPEWAGKRDEELAKVTGVRDAVFCHNARFLAVAESKEGAISLAKKALMA